MIQKLFSITMALSLLLISPAFTQSYGNSIGIRLGDQHLSRTFGFTANQRIAKRSTIEGIFQTDFKYNTTGHLLYKKHYPIITKRLNYFYGGGLSLGKEMSYHKNAMTNELIHTYGNSTRGIDLIAGLDMTIAKANISFDYKPNLNIVGRSNFYQAQYGISVRKVMVTAKEQNKKIKASKRATQQKGKNPSPEKSFPINLPRRNN